MTPESVVGVVGGELPPIEGGELVALLGRSGRA